MGLSEELSRRFEADRIAGAVERTCTAIDRQTRAIESLDRPVEDGPRLPGVVLFVGGIVLVLLLPVVLQLPSSFWYPFGRALHRAGTVLAWGGNFAIWFGLLWLVTWPVRKVLRRLVPRRTPPSMSPSARQR